MASTMDRFFSKLDDKKARLKARLKGSSRSHTPEPSSSSLPNVSDLNNPTPKDSLITPTSVSTSEIAPISIPAVAITPSTSVAPMLSDAVTPAPIGPSSTHPSAILASDSSSPHKISVKENTRTTVSVLNSVLANAGGVFEPLRSAVTAVYECAELYDVEAANEKEYATIIADLEARFQDLARYFNSPTPPAMTSSILNFATGITRETDYIKQKARRSPLGRYAQATQDASDILECYRRIHTIVERLVQNANVSMWKIVDEEATERRLKDLGQSSAAWYRSAESSGRRNKCTKKTRTELLLDMNDWAHEGQEKVYWLNGMAGTGKTTIAYSLSDELHANRKLAASFFCSRQLPSCRDVKLILPTIAYQLARFSRPFRYALSRILDQNPDVHTREISEQFEGLIAEPLREVQISMPENLVVVVDGLDECENHGEVQTLLDVILSHTSSLAIKFFVSSRPEPAIISRIQIQRGEGALFQLRLHELEHTVVSQDIETYLKDQLSYMELVPAELHTLTSQCGVLFIYAATAVRYIKADNPARSPDRLREILEAPISINDQEETIDSLYTAIIGAAFNNKKLREKDRREMTLVIRSVVCAQEPLTPAMITRLLNIRSESLVHAALAPFLSVLTISEASGVVNTLHASFLDYLFDEDRSGRFYCDSSKHNGILAQACFDMIKVPEPPFNICGLESSFILDRDVPGLSERVDSAISSELLYACRHWGSHLELAQTSEDLLDVLSEFLSVRLLLWMEVMNLKQCVHEGAKAISLVHAWCQRAESTKKIRDMTLDTSKFLTALSLSPVLQSTPHIYVSALAVWPEERPISRSYGKTAKNLIKMLGTAMTQRGSALRAVLTARQSILSIAYSSDGAYIVSGSLDSTIRIWDAQTGQMVGSPLEGHTGWINSVSYSPDGAHIVSGSSDRTIRIWDAHTGQMVGSPLEGHTDWIRSVSYSPDGAHIVSGSLDRTIRIWDAQTGEMVGSPLEGHTDSINSVSYSPNGAHIVSGSDDKFVRIWNSQDHQRSDELPEVGNESAQILRSSSIKNESGSGPHGSPGKAPTTDWRIDENGWVISGRSELLMWVPIDLRPVLRRPQNIAVISRRGWLGLDFSNASLGPMWHRCYQPATSNSRKR